MGRRGAWPRFGRSGHGSRNCSPRCDRAGTRGAAPAAEELVRLLLGLYGDGLGHIMAALHESGDAVAAVLDKRLADPLVESLLVLHDLHPLDVDARIQLA